MVVGMKDRLAALDRQNAEFDALTDLAEQWARLQQVVVVDDEYPQYRSKYEGAMHRFINAIRDNGRL